MCTGIKGGLWGRGERGEARVREGKVGRGVAGRGGTGRGEGEGEGGRSGAGRARACVPRSAGASMPCRVQRRSETTRARCGELTKTRAVI